MTDKRFHLFWFHHAGGSSTFYADWLTILPTHWQVHLIELPGRGLNFSTPFYACWDELLVSINKKIADISPENFAFAGHSLGAMIAHRLTAYRYHRAESLPLWLGISAIRAPNLVSKTQYHQLNDEKLHDEMKDALPDKLAKYPEILAMVLEILRQDLFLAETAITMPVLPLPIPISLFYAHDDEVVSLHEMTGWQQFTQYPVIWRKFNGNHMYLEKQKERICELITHDVNHVLFENIKV
jgi:surfactin synthase thioesterase subunit